MKTNTEPIQITMKTDLHLNMEFTPSDYFTLDTKQKNNNKIAWFKFGISQFKRYQEIESFHIITSFSYCPRRNVLFLTVIDKIDSQKHDSSYKVVEYPLEPGAPTRYIGYSNKLNEIVTDISESHLLKQIMIMDNCVYLCTVREDSLVMTIKRKELSRNALPKKFNDLPVFIIAFSPTALIRCFPSINSFAINNKRSSLVIVKQDIQFNYCPRKDSGLFIDVRYNSQLKKYFILRRKIRKELNSFIDIINYNNLDLESCIIVNCIITSISSNDNDLYYTSKNQIFHLNAVTF